MSPIVAHMPGGSPPSVPPGAYGVLCGDGGQPGRRACRAARVGRRPPGARTPRGPAGGAGTHGGRPRKGSTAPLGVGRYPPGGSAAAGGGSTRTPVLGSTAVPGDPGPCLSAGAVGPAAVVRGAAGAGGSDAVGPVGSCCHRRGRAGRLLRGPGRVRATAVGGGRRRAAGPAAVAVGGRVRGSPGGGGDPARRPALGPCGA